MNERYIPILYSSTVSNQLLPVYSLSSYSLSYPATVGQSTELDPNDGSPICIPNDAAIYVYRHKIYSNDRCCCNSNNYGTKKPIDQEDKHSKRTSVWLKRGEKVRESESKTEEDTNSQELSQLAEKKLEEIRPSHNNSSVTEKRQHHYYNGLPFPPTLDLSTLKEVTVPLNWASKCAAYRAANRKDYTGEINGGSILPLFFCFYLHCYLIFQLSPACHHVRPTPWENFIQHPM